MGLPKELFLCPRRSTTCSYPEPDESNPVISHFLSMPFDVIVILPSNSSSINLSSTFAFSDYIVNVFVISAMRSSESAHGILYLIALTIFGVSANYEITYFAVLFCLLSLTLCCQKLSVCAPASGRESPGN